MWTVIYMARNHDMATKLKNTLEDGGLLVKIKTVNKSQESEDMCYEVLVPSTEVEEAHNIIIEIGF